jgi:ER lumen protein retaining receptor
MVVNRDVFRILGDVSHTVSKRILIWAIHWNRSAEGMPRGSTNTASLLKLIGVSLITQSLYALVFCAGYPTLVMYAPSSSHWTFSLNVWALEKEKRIQTKTSKIFYILSSLYIIYFMMYVFARTREREKAWKLGAVCLGGATVLAPFVMLIFRKKKEWAVQEVWYHQNMAGGGCSWLQYFWILSIILESVCVLPQLVLLRQTTVPTVIDSFYLLTLGSYRAFYILDWIVGGVIEEHSFESVAVIFEVIQTILYIDFGWVYWTRQRVKLRNGGVVDSEDLGRGWLISKILRQGQQTEALDDQVPVTPGDSNPRATKPTGSKNGWGARGISVSADDTLDRQDREANERPRKSPTTRNETGPAQEDERRGILEGLSDDEDSGAEDLQLPPLNKKDVTSVDVGDGGEWRDGFHDW